MDLGGARLRVAGGGGSQVVISLKFNEGGAIRSIRLTDDGSPTIDASVGAQERLRRTRHPSFGRCDVHPEAYGGSGGRRRRDRLVGVGRSTESPPSVDDLTELASATVRYGV